MQDLSTPLRRGHLCAWVIPLVLLCVQPMNVAAQAASLPLQKHPDVIAVKVRASGPGRFDFDVTRCRYTEMYRALGIPELGAVLSCQRDAALIEGFNPGVTLERTQIIMQGAPCCNFRYRARNTSPDDSCLK